MKLILILILIFTLNVEVTKTETIMENITVTVKDITTNETLVGVKIGDKYTNFDGNVKVKKGDYNLDFISYQNIKILIDHDTIIYLKNIE